MVDEIEVDLEDASSRMHREGAEAAGIDVQRHMPTMIEPG